MDHGGGVKMNKIKNIGLLTVIMSFYLLLFSSFAVGASGQNYGAEESKQTQTGSMNTVPAVPGEIVDLTLSQYNVAVGDKVTAKVWGSGTCLSWLGTSGADGSEGLSDLYIDQSPLPHYHSFTAEKAGTYTIAVMGLKPNQTGCIAAEKGSVYITTTLTVSSAEDILKEKATKPQFVKPPLGVSPGSTEDIKDVIGGISQLKQQESEAKTENNQIVERSGSHSDMVQQTPQPKEYPNLVFAKASAVCDKKTRTVNIGLIPQNTGKATAGPFTMDVKIGGKKVKSYNYAGLNEGATGRAKRLFYQLSTKEASGVWVEVRLDGGKRVSESNDNDNTKRWRMSCSPERKVSTHPIATLDPKFRITLSTGDSALKVGESAKVKVKVTNVGKGVGPNMISYSLFCSPNSPFKSNSGKFSALKPNKSHTFSLTGKMTSQGNYKIRLKTRYGKSNTLSLKVTPKISRSSSRGDHSRFVAGPGPTRNANRSDTGLVAGRMRQLR